MRQPWRLKSLAHRAIGSSSIGIRVLGIAQSRISSPRAALLDAPPASWRRHARFIELTPPGSIVEIGSGSSLTQAMWLAQTVKRSYIALDRQPLATAETVNKGIAGLRTMAPELVHCLEDISEVEDLRAVGVDYRAPARLDELDDHSISAIISTNVLEHIPVEELDKMLSEASRVLVPGGVFSAKIDYTDHYSHTDPRIGSLQYLQFSARQWARHNHYSMYQNRLRHQDYRALLRQQGFTIVEEVGGRALVAPTSIDARFETSNPETFLGSGHYVARVDEAARVDESARGDESAKS